MSLCTEFQTWPGLEAMARFLDCPWLFSCYVCFCLHTTVDMESHIDWPWLSLNRTQLQSCVT